MVQLLMFTFPVLHCIINSPFVCFISVCLVEETCLETLTLFLLTLFVIRKKQQDPLYCFEVPQLLANQDVIE